MVKKLKKKADAPVKEKIDVDIREIYKDKRMWLYIEELFDCDRTDHIRDIDLFCLVKEKNIPYTHIYKDKYFKKPFKTNYILNIRSINRNLYFKDVDEYLNFRDSLPDELANEYQLFVSCGCDYDYYFAEHK